VGQLPGVSWRGACRRSHSCAIWVAVGFEAARLAGDNRNQAFGNYLWAATTPLATTRREPVRQTSSLPTLRPTGVDPNIRWKRRARRTAASIRALSQRVSGTVDFYSKKTSRLIFRIPHRPAVSSSRDHEIEAAVRLRVFPADIRVDAGRTQRVTNSLPNGSRLVVAKGVRGSQR